MTREHYLWQWHYERPISLGESGVFLLHQLFKCLSSIARSSEVKPEFAQHGTRSMVFTIDFIAAAAVSLELIGKFSLSGSSEASFSSISGFCSALGRR